MSTSLLHITTVPMSLTFLRGQIGYMRERGLAIHAVSSPGPELDEFATREAVPVTGVEMSRRITPVRDLVALARIVRVLNRMRPAIVHAHTPKGGLLGMLGATIHGAHVRIYHMRGLPLTGATGFRRRLLWLSEWVSCKLAHRVLCVSHSVRQEAIEAGLCPPEKIRVPAGGSGNGVDAAGRFNPERLEENARADTRSRLGIPPDARVVGFVGRIVRDKGIVELATAWRELRATYDDAHLVLVGPLEPQDPVPEAALKDLRQDDRVHLVGMDWNTPPLYAAMDVVTLPTYREGFPNVPLEAAAMGLPVVATRIPGCIDAVVDGVTGTLVAPKDPVELRDAIAQYLEDERLRREHGGAGQERVRRDFRQEVIWESVFSEYQALLRDAGAIPNDLDSGSGSGAEALAGYTSARVGE